MPGFLDSNYQLTLLLFMGQYIIGRQNNEARAQAVISRKKLSTFSHSSSFILPKSPMEASSSGGSFIQKRCPHTLAGFGVEYKQEGKSLYTAPPKA